jgi:hypothetical protein
MGLRMEEFEVISQLPTIEEIKTHLGDLASDISFVGSLNATPQDEARINSQKQSGKSIPLREKFVQCSHQGELLRKKKGITYAHIHASLTGDKVFLVGNNNRLIDSLMDALTSSGCVRRNSC